MAQLISAPRGTRDVYGAESRKWQFLEEKLSGICRRFGYSEVRIPTFEHTELFARGVGDTTDIVGKEMYTFLDKGNRSITLRPEGTAGVARSFLQNGVLNEALPVRGYYILPCFRYEKPQSGRYREFHQLGIEMFGAPSADADCEVIRVAATILKEVGIKNIRLEINSIGCRECRPKYHAALTEYFKKHEGELCETCLDRLTRNPLRILDCKSPICSEIAKDAPYSLDYLCDECKEHFEKVKQLLDEAGIEYSINPRIVRGLDYYSKTVFEFIHEAAGAQGTVCGGGRYDGLIEILGGSPTAGIGFGMGLERLLDVAIAEGVEFPEPDAPEIFLCAADEGAKKTVRRLVFELQSMGVRAQYDLNERSLKAQLKYANKADAKYSLVIGENEVNSKKGELKNMTDGCTISVDIDAAQLAAAIRQ